MTCCRPWTSWMAWICCGGRHRGSRLCWALQTHEEGIFAAECVQRSHSKDERMTARMDLAPGRRWNALGGAGDVGGEDDDDDERRL